MKGSGMNVKRRAGLTVATAGLAVGVLAPQGAAALPRPAGADRPQATIQVVAGGLNTPRGLIYDAATHDVLVAESGSAAGDTGKCGIGEGGGQLCFGTTGSIFAYNTVTGRGKEMITGLPSESLQPAGSAVLGLEALDLYKGQLNGVFGLLGFPSTRTAEGPGAAALGQVAHIASNGTLTPFGDIAKFEIKTYGKGEESDPYDLLTGTYGTLIVNAGGHAVNGNIGGNDVELVNPSGQLSQVAAFPQRYWKNKHILNNLIESVPTTAVKVGNAFYVGELSGAPYFQDSARIWRVVPGKTPHVFDYGFTNIISMTTDQSGNLIVLEIAKKGLSNADQTGALYKVSLATGQKTLLASIGLTNPGGVVEVGNVFYVTNYTTSTGGIGQLLKVTVPNP
jgi:hypothetical protein